MIYQLSLVSMFTSWMLTEISQKRFSLWTFLVMNDDEYGNGGVAGYWVDLPCCHVMKWKHALCNIQTEAANCDPNNSALAVVAFHQSQMLNRYCILRMGGLSCMIFPTSFQISNMEVSMSSHDVSDRSAAPAPVMCTSTDSGCFIIEELFTLGLEEIVQKIFLYLDPKRC